MQNKENKWEVEIYWKEFSLFIDGSNVISPTYKCSIINAIYQKYLGKFYNSNITEVIWNKALSSSLVLDIPVVTPKFSDSKE